MAKKKTKKKPNNSSFIVFFAVLAIFIAFAVGFVKINAERKQKQEQYNELSSIYESQTEANSNLKETIKNGVEDELAEEYAHKEGYVNPDEHVYIDITPGDKN